MSPLFTSSFVVVVVLLVSSICPTALFLWQGKLLIVSQSANTLALMSHYTNVHCFFVLMECPFESIFTHENKYGNTVNKAPYIVGSGM